MMRPVDPRGATPQPFPGPIQAALMVVDTLAAMWSLGPEMALRRGFGRRYLSWLSIFSVLFTIVVVKALLGVALLIVHLFTSWAPRPILIRVAGAALAVYPIDLLFVLVLILGVAHHAEILWRHRRGIPCHTRYGGRPLPLFFLVSGSEVTIKRFLEPLFVSGVSLYVGLVDPLMGWYLWAAAGAMFVRANLAYYRLMSRVWDLNDAMIEQQFTMSLMCDHGRALELRPATLVAPAEPPSPPDLVPVARIYGLLEGFAGLVTLPEPVPTTPPGPAPSPPPGAEAADRLILVCPQCGRRLSIPARLSGRAVRCPHCRQSVPARPGAAGVGAAP